MKRLGKSSLNAVLAEGLELSKSVENGIWLQSWFKASPKISPFLKIHLITAVTSNKRVGDDGIQSLNTAASMVVKPHGNVSLAFAGGGVKKLRLTRRTLLKRVVQVNDGAIIKISVWSVYECVCVMGLCSHCVVSSHCLCDSMLKMYASGPPMSRWLNEEGI